MSVWQQEINLQTSTPWLVYAYVSTIDFGQVVVAWCVGNMIVFMLHINVTKRDFPCPCFEAGSSMSENVTFAIEIYTLVIYHRRNECGASTFAYHRFWWRAFV